MADDRDTTYRNLSPLIRAWEDHYRARFGRLTRRCELLAYRNAAAHRRPKA